MKRRHRHNLLVWLALLAIGMLEVGLSFVPFQRGLRPILMLPAASMATLVALGYMRLLDAPGIARGFAIAGVFWLTVLLGLAMNDPLTRVIYPVAQ